MDVMAGCGIRFAVIPSIIHTVQVNHMNGFAIDAFPDC
jgi:hypothetical protein